MITLLLLFAHAIRLGAFPEFQPAYKKDAGTVLRHPRKPLPGFH
jgi:hypothetical protein